MRNSLGANDLQFVRINAEAAELIQTQANLAVVTKHSAELSFLQPQTGQETARRSVWAHSRPIAGRKQVGSTNCMAGTADAFRADRRATETHLK